MATILRTHKNPTPIVNAISSTDMAKLINILTDSTVPITANMSLWCKFNENDGSTFQLNLPLLHIAASKGNCNIAKILLKHNSKVDAIDKYGTTALHWAATAGHTGFVQLLVKNNANIDQCDFLGMTALHSAAHNGRTKTVKCLLKLGADHTIKSKANELALHLAIAQNNTNCVKILDIVQKSKKRIVPRKQTQQKSVSFECESSQSCHGRTNTRITLQSETETESETAESVNEIEFENESEKYELRMDKIDINQISLMESDSFSSEFSSFDEENLRLENEKTDLKLESKQLRNAIKALQTDKRQLKATHRQRETVSKQKQMTKDLKSAKERLIHLKSEQKSKQRKSAVQSEKLKALKSERSAVLRKYGKVNTKKLKKQLYHKLRVLQKMNAENYKLQTKKIEIMQLQRRKKSDKKECLAGLEQKQTDFNKWIKDIVSLPFYAVKFEKYEYNRLDIVKHLDESELKKIGIKNYYHRMKFVNKIKHLNKTNHEQIGI